MSSDALLLQRLRPTTVVLTQSYTRPADTNTYAAGDVVAESTSAATILTFTGFAKAAGLGATIQAVTFVDSAAQTLKPEFELYLFDTAPTMQNDNVAWAPSDSEMEKCLGVIALPSQLFKTAGANGVISVDGPGRPIQCASSVSSIYGILVTRNAYVPISGEKFVIRLHVSQD